MFPGLTSKCSEESIAAAAHIYPKTDIIHVADTTATTALQTIDPPYAGFSGILLVSNRSGADISTVTTGNISAARTIPNNFLVPFIYSQLHEEWIPGAIS